MAPGSANGNVISEGWDTAMGATRSVMLSEVVSVLIASMRYISGWRTRAELQSKPGRVCRQRLNPLLSVGPSELRSQTFFRCGPIALPA